MEKFFNPNVDTDIKFVFPEDKNNPRFQLFFPGKSSLLFLPLIFHHKKKKYPSDQGGTLCFKDISSIARVDIPFDSNIPAKFLIPTWQTSFQRLLFEMFLKSSERIQTSILTQDVKNLHLENQILNNGFSVLLSILFLGIIRIITRKKFTSKLFCLLSVCLILKKLKNQFFVFCFFYQTTNSFPIFLQVYSNCQAVWF